MQHGTDVKVVLHCNYIYARLPEEEISRSKHVEEIKKLKIKILI